jgi:hypothetical protein
MLVIFSWFGDRGVIEVKIKHKYSATHENITLMLKEYFIVT